MVIRDLPHMLFAVIGALLGFSNAPEFYVVDKKKCYCWEITAMGS